MPAGVLPGVRRHTIPLTDQGAEGGRVPGVPLQGPIVAPRHQIFLPDMNNPHLEKMYLHSIIPSLVYIPIPGGEMFVFIELFLLGLE